jgi:hypothetical protein
MITAIVTANDTKLTIITLEELFLEQMGPTVQRTKLIQGVNDIVLKAGVFKVQSKKGVRVKAGGQSFDMAVTPNDKDGGPIELSHLVPSLDRPEVVTFLSDAKATPAPR